MEQMNPCRVLFTVTREAQPECSQCLLKDIGGLSLKPRSLKTEERDAAI